MNGVFKKLCIAGFVVLSSVCFAAPVALIHDVKEHGADPDNLKGQIK